MARLNTLIMLIRPLISQNPRSVKPVSPTQLPAHPTDPGEKATSALCGARVAHEKSFTESASADCLMCYERQWRAAVLESERKHFPTWYLFS